MKRRAVYSLCGSAAVAAWLTLFAAGLLIDSKTYRAVINVAPATAIAADTPGSAEGGAHGARAGLPPFAWEAFGVSMLTYTPLNAALLVIFAGFIGGCASRLAYDGKVSTDPPGPNATVEERRAADRAMFLTETPVASMLRSFLVYLGILAGVYVAAGAPFEQATADQYVRFVGTMSLLAFVVGYDPTKFEDLLSMVPRPGAK